MTSFPRTAITAVAAGLLLVTAAGCAPPAEREPTSLTVGVPFLGVGNNPLNYGNLIFLASQATYEPLLMWNQETNQYDPWLATGWSLDEDRTTLSLTLREDVDFVDGVHFDAAGLETYLDALFASETYLWHTLYSDEFATEVTATGEYTVELTTRVPISRFFMQTLNYTPIASPEAIEDAAALEEEAVGSGPYILDESVPDVSMSFVRNPDYWNPDAYDFDTVTFTVFSDNVAALNALKSGQIDATRLDISLADEAEANGFAIHAGAGQFGTLIVLDSAGEILPPLGDVRVRQAMNLAFDREAILESLDLGHGAVSSQPLTTRQDGYVEGGDERYGYDPERARELLAEAGYPDGFDVTIPTVPAGTQYAARYEPIVQQSLADIGIRVTYEPLVDEAALFPALTEGRYPLALFNNFFDATVRYLNEGTSPSFSRMLDSRGRELLDVVNQGTAAESEQAIADLGEYILDQAWYVPFSKPDIVVASIPEIDVVVGDLDGWTRLYQFTLAA